MAAASQKKCPLDLTTNAWSFQRAFFLGVAGLSVPADKKNASWEHIGALAFVQGVFFIGIHYYPCCLCYYLPTK